MAKFLGLLLIALMALMGRSNDSVAETFMKMDSLHHVAVISIIVVAAIIIAAKLLMSTDNTNDDDNNDDDDNDKYYHYGNHKSKSKQFKIETDEVNNNTSFISHNSCKPIIFYPQNFYVPKEKDTVSFEEPIIQKVEEIEFTADELKTQILQYIQFGKKRCQEVIEKLTQLNKIEDTSEFLEKYPQVLQYVFNS